MPPYTFVISTLSLTFVMFIVKFKNPGGSFGLAMMLMINLVASAALVNLLSIELANSGITKGDFGNVSVSTALILSAGSLQLFSSVGGVIAIAKIKDPGLIKIW